MSCRVHGIDGIKFFMSCSDEDLQRLLFLASTVETGKVQGFNDTEDTLSCTGRLMHRQALASTPQQSLEEIEATVGLAIRQLERLRRGSREIRSTPGW